MRQRLTPLTSTSSGPDPTSSDPATVGDRGLDALPRYRTKTAAVADWLRDQILSRRIPPGTPLLQNRTAKSIGVSSTPVREAFGALEAEGFLVRSPHRGVIVVDRADDDVEDAHRIRMVLEEYAVRTLIERPDPAVTTEARQALQRGEAAVRAADRAAFREANIAFHLALVRGGRSKTLMNVMRLLLPASSSYTSLDQTSMVERHREHLTILEAIAGQDPARAADLLRRHVPLTSRALTRVLGDSADQGPIVDRRA